VYPSFNFYFLFLTNFPLNPNGGLGVKIHKILLHFFRKKRNKIEVLGVCQDLIEFVKVSMLRSLNYIYRVLKENSNGRVKLNFFERWVY
jgi:hypothetical protein